MSNSQALWYTMYVQFGSESFWAGLPRESGKRLRFATAKKGKSVDGPARGDSNAPSMRHEIITSGGNCSAFSTTNGFLVSVWRDGTGSYCPPLSKDLVASDWRAESQTTRRGYLERIEGILRDNTCAAVARSSWKGFLRSLIHVVSIILNV